LDKDFSELDGFTGIGFVNIVNTKVHTVHVDVNKKNYLVVGICPVADNKYVFSGPDPME
jgi:hypothetical protein